MKKLLFLLLSVLLLSCSKDKVDNKPTPEQDKPTTEQDKPTTEQDKPMPEEDKPTPEEDKPTISSTIYLSLEAFVLDNPKCKKEVEYMYFEGMNFVQTGIDLKGLTKYSANEFMANETKEYKISISLNAPLMTYNYHHDVPYYLVVKVGGLDKHIIKSDDNLAPELIEIELNKGDVLSFHLAAEPSYTPFRISNKGVKIELSEKEL